MRHQVTLVMLLLASASAAGNSLVSSGPNKEIAKSSLSAAPVGEWNRLKYREGQNVEVWTLDGPLLNRVVFFGGIEAGKPLVKEEDKKRFPLPKFSDSMILTDIPGLLESTYRAQGRVSQIEIETQEPTKVSGRSAIRFTYRFVRGEYDVLRRGEGVGTVMNKRLYLVVYEAPALHFFAKDLEKYRQLVSTLSISAND
jgi:hypothetical protein